MLEAPPEETRKHPLGWMIILVLLSVLLVAGGVLLLWSSFSTTTATIHPPTKTPRISTPVPVPTRTLLSPSSSPTDQPTAVPMAQKTYPEVQGVLPAPLYFIGENHQVMRLNLDGTLTEITKEENGVSQIDVSPIDGRIAYTMLPEAGLQQGTRLTVVDRDGGNPQAVVDGFKVGQPVWSPDGKRLAYALDGVKAYDFESGEWLDILPNRAMNNNFIIICSPLAWSPDGKTILIQMKTDQYSTAIYHLDGSLVQGIPMYCASAGSYSLDGKDFYIGVDWFGETVDSPCEDEPLIWRLSTSANTQSRLKMDSREGDTMFLARSPFVATDGRLYFLYTRAPFDAQNKTIRMEVEPSYVLASCKLDGSDFHILNSTATSAGFSEMVWAPDGSFVVIKRDDTFIILNTKDNASIVIDLPGSDLHWGVP